jgi:hypothetical protein
MAEVPTMTVIDPADPTGEAIMVINKSEFDPRKYRLPGSPIPKVKAAATVTAPSKGNNVEAYDTPPAAKK